MQVQWKRFLSLVMAIVMVVSMIPANVVFAEENADGTDGEVLVEPTTEPVTEAPAEPEATEAETEAPAEPEATEAETEAPTEPEATEAETEAPTEPEATEAETEEPTEPETSEPVAIGPETEKITVTAVPDVDLPDSEELFAYFVERELYDYDASTYGTTARSGLTALEQEIYDALKAKIETVAANGGGTQFILSNVSGLKTLWTNTELGVSSINSSAIVETAFCSQFDFDKIATALLADCPFDLYWYDKVEGVQMTYQISRSGIDYGTYAVWDTATITDLTFVFTVSADYESGENWVTADVARVSAAKDLAAQVVAANAGKSDYEKLVAYKDYICNAVDYNHAAAENTNTPYGDPWQLISVFDGDNATNVVCEGYAKGFQYLCDLGGLDCISVSGSTVGGTGAGRHMWNVVTLDGAKYLVDVTNSDTGSIGQNGGLFLSGGTYQDGYYSFTCGSQTIYFVCDDLGLSVADYVYEIPAETYTVTVADCENGTVTAESAIAEAGEEILLTVIPETGYTLQTLTVTWGEDQSVEVTGNKFTMPAGDATVAATFTKTALASGTCGENLTWALDDEYILTISGTGDMTDYEYASSVPWKQYRESIVAVAINEGVTGIGANAFYNCSSLTSVTIPSTLTRIGKNAFYGCSGLKLIYIPDSVTVIAAGSYSSSPFYGCSGNLKIYCGAATEQSGWRTYWNYTDYSSSNKAEVYYGYTFEEYQYWSSVPADITTLEIPDTMTRIPAMALANFKSLHTVTIPDSVTTICTKAFYNCSGLTQVELPDTLSRIDSYAFAGCTGLTEIVIPDSVETVEDAAFFGCTSLKRATLGSGMSKIPAAMFESCTGLTDVTIPSGITELGSDAFRNCTALTAVYIPETVTTVPTNASSTAFYKCSEALVIYCGAESMPDSWSGWEIYDAVATKKLTVNYGYSRAEYEYWAGIDRTQTSITIADGITRIPERAFYNAENLTQIYIPDSVVSIGAKAFTGCTNLNNVYIPAAKCGPEDFGSMYLNVYFGIENDGWGDSWKGRGHFGYTREEYDYWMSVDKTAASVVIREGITKIPERFFSGSTYTFDAHQRLCGGNEKRNTIAQIPANHTPAKARTILLKEGSATFEHERAHNKK